MEKAKVTPEPTNDTNSRFEGGKFLSFYLGSEEYAIQILSVQEIIGLMPITPVPNMPGYICGVLNLRGKIIPVMNLRVRFGLERVENTDETCIIVIQEAQQLVGVLVDRVSEVSDIDAQDIGEVPSFGIAASTKYLSGIAQCDDNVQMLVDIDEVIGTVPDEITDSNTVEQEESALAE